VLFLRHRNRYLHIATRQRGL